MRDAETRGGGGEDAETRRGRDAGRQRRGDAEPANGFEEFVRV